MHFRDKYSNWVRVTGWVPPGLVLRPLLFLVYVKDFLTGLESYLNMFAFDAKIMRKVRSHKDYENHQSDLNKPTWSGTWLMGSTYPNVW